MEIPQVEVTWETLAEYQVTGIHVSFWKMNVLAVSEEDDLLVVACGDAIRAFHLRPDFTCGDYTERRVPRSPATAEGAEINHIKAGVYAGERVVAAVTMDSQVAIFSLSSLSQPPVLLNNYSEEYEDNSTWSLAFHKSAIAVGSNAYTISVWDNTDFRGRLEKHQHNVPALDFSPEERYLASTSIDSSVIIWEGSTAVTSFRPSREWGWGVKWLSKRDFHDSPPLSRGTESLQDLVLAHTSQSELHLVSFTPTNRRVMEFSMQHTMNQFGHRRLSLMETASHLGLLLVGEWGGTKVYMIRLVYREGAYSGEVLATHETPQLLLGLSVSPGSLRLDYLCVRLYLLLLNNSVQVLQLRRDFPHSLCTAYV